MRPPDPKDPEVEMVRDELRATLARIRKKGRTARVNSRMFRLRAKLSGSKRVVVPEELEAELEKELAHDGNGTGRTAVPGPVPD